MKELAEINYIEERNGITEALFLLEQRLAQGCFDLETVLRALFSYWFMLTEPAYFTNDDGSRDWVRIFNSLLRRAELFYSDNADFCWIVGYLLSNFPKDPELRRQGRNLLDKAVQIAPDNLMARMAQTDSQLEGEFLPPQTVVKLNDWGMMGEFFKYRFVK